MVRLVITLLGLVLIFNSSCKNPIVLNAKETIIKVRYPEEDKRIKHPIQIPHYYAQQNNYQTIEGLLTKDGFYEYKLNISFPRYIKIGAMPIQITPTDTVIIDYQKKPYIRSVKDSTLWHFNEIFHHLQQSKLTGIVPGSSQYYSLSPLQFEQRIDSFYLAGKKSNSEYFIKNSHLKGFYRYYANCELLFRVGKEINDYVIRNPCEDTVKTIIYPTDFFKYNDSIATNFNQLYFSECGNRYFNTYHYIISRKCKSNDYETALNYTIDNTSGLVQDIILGKMISLFQLFEFKEQNLPLSLSFAEKIKKDQLRKSLLLSINQMKDSQVKANKETAENQPKGIKEILKKYDGKIVYVQFWATWCGPCHADAEYLDDLNKQINNKDFKIVNICVRSPKLTWEQQLSSNNHFGEHIYLSDLEFMNLEKEIAIPNYPFYLIIDRMNNKIIKDAPRPFINKDLTINEDLTKLINEMLKD